MACTRSYCRGRQRGSSAPAGRGCWALAARDPEPSVGSLLAGGRPAVPLRGGAQRVRRRQASHRCARSRCGWCEPFTFFRRKYLTGFLPSPAGSSEQPSACPSGGLSRSLRAVRPPEGRKSIERTGNGRLRAVQASEKQGVIIGACPSKPRRFRPRFRLPSALSFLRQRAPLPFRTNPTPTSTARGGGPRCIRAAMHPA